MINLPLEVDGYKFSALDNPRKSDYILGDIKCDICGCQTSVYLELLDEQGQGGSCYPIEMVICGTCLEDFSWALKKRTLETFRESVANREDK